MMNALLGWVSVSSLLKEEGGRGNVHYGEDHVGFVANGREGDWSYHHDLGESLV